MSTPENIVKSKIKDALGRLWNSVRIFTNPSGVGWMGKATNSDGRIILCGGRRVEFGLSPGSSDFILIVKRKITQADVGKEIGQFCAIEAKAPGWKPPKSGGEVYEHYLKQLHFINMVNSMGGKAGFACSIEDAKAILLLDEEA